jgi:hypothetical protein
MAKNKEAFIRRNVVAIGSVFRFSIIVVPFFLEKSGFLPDEFERLMYLLLPLSCVYFTFFIKFIIKGRYQKEGNELTKTYIGFGEIALLLLCITELSLIILRGLYDVAEGGQFFLLIALLESCFGIYAGFYLSDLFSYKTTRGGIKAHTQ